MKCYDAIVLGIGGVGSAALYHLARRGARVLGVDRFTPPHDRGSTHGHTRVIRQAYFEHPDYVPLLRESYREWHELEAGIGKPLFHQIGLVEIGPPNGCVVPGVLRAAERHHLAVEPLSAKEIMNRWPGLVATDDLTAVFEPTAGYLLVEDCVQAHLDMAAREGAELLLEQEIKDWTIGDKEIRIRTVKGHELAASQLVVAAGAWTGQILAQLNLKLEVRRKSLFWFAADDASLDISSGMPVFLYELPDGIFYGFPKIDGRGIKVAEHSGGRPTIDPLSVHRDIDPREQKRLEDFLATHLPRVSPRVMHHSVCLYTMSPDEHFIVDRPAAMPNVSIVAGLSGHGFKFTPVLGRALADLALDGTTTLPIDFLSLTRFAS